MKKIISLLLLITLLFSFTACQKENNITIGIPNDTTNEARALLLLQDLNIIKLKEGTDITATVNDIEDNPYNIEFKEIEAAQLPNYLSDLDYAVINSNYAINSGLNPIKDALAIENESSYYANVLVVKEGHENDTLVLALLAAMRSKQVADYISEAYDGSVVSTVEELTDGYDASIDYESLKGQTITIACSPTPHSEILKIAQQILAQKDITVDIQEFTDYILPNNVVEDETVMVNYFQHLPYLNDFNEKNNTHLVSIGAIHVEPMGIYGGIQNTLDVIYDRNK